MPILKGFDVRSQLVKGEISPPMMTIKQPGSKAGIRPLEKAHAIQRKQLDELQKIMEYARLNYAYSAFDEQFKQIAELIVDDSGIHTERDMMLEKLKKVIASYCSRRRGIGNSEFGFRNVLLILQKLSEWV